MSEQKEPRRQDGIQWSPSEASKKPITITCFFHFLSRFFFCSFASACAWRTSGRSCRPAGGTLTWRKRTCSIRRCCTTIPTLAASSTHSPSSPSAPKPSPAVASAFLKINYCSVIFNPFGDSHKSIFVSSIDFQFQSGCPAVAMFFFAVSLLILSIFYYFFIGFFLDQLSIFFFIFNSILIALTTWKNWGYFFFNAYGFICYQLFL